MTSKVQNMKTEHYIKYNRSRKSQNYYINCVDKKGGSNGELYYILIVLFTGFVPKSRVTFHGG
jgi:hypothetical protein